MWAVSILQLSLDKLGDVLISGVEGTRTKSYGNVLIKSVAALTAIIIHQGFITHISLFLLDVTHFILVRHFHFFSFFFSHNIFQCQRGISSKNESSTSFAQTRSLSASFTFSSSNVIRASFNARRTSFSFNLIPIKTISDLRSPYLSFHLFATFNSSSVSEFSSAASHAAQSSSFGLSPSESPFG